MDMLFLFVLLGSVGAIVIMFGFMSVWGEVVIVGFILFAIGFIGMVVIVNDRQNDHEKFCEVALENANSLADFKMYIEECV